jgi:DNA helicase II / ATP-dependent DNA helicase PcrA
MPPITSAEIEYAETILFGRISVFNGERRTYIEELDSCDLQAVPGSGKTTALLGKLLILERHLPFDDHRGILVISHTNAAIDEIKEKIGKHCPKLFNAPNFVGTIQSFVDRFLAVPYYVQLHKRKPSRIDDEIYLERTTKMLDKWFAGFSRIEQNNAKFFLRSNDNGIQIRITPGNLDDELTKGYLGNPINVQRPRNRNDWTPAEKERIKAWVWQFKKQVFQDGYLCFDDAYYLANKYLRQFPGIISILRKRFRYIFVDEMQDMAGHQYQLLEDIFGNAPDSTYQRIGDKNQAIYSGKSVQNTQWIDRITVHRITGSHRLSPLNAAIVQRFALHPIPVTGLRTNADTTPIPIKPHLLIYNDANILQVVPTFADLIRQYRIAGQIPLDCKHPFKAVCWTTQEEPQKIRIKNFYPFFDKGNVTPRVNYECLESYLYVFPQGRTIRSIYKNVLNALLRVLRVEGVVDAHGRYFTKTSLLDSLMTSHPVEYDVLRLHLYTWCRDLLCGREQAVLQNIRSFIPQLLALFGKVVAESLNFNTTQFKLLAAGNAGAVSTSNIFSSLGIDVEVTTIHSTKGQTHTATLYLESYYQRSVQNAGNYESERLACFLLNQPRPANIHEYVQQSLKMTYVGFSRPTHLLCFAVHENRFNQRLTTLDKAEWEIIYI